MNKQPLSPSMRQWLLDQIDRWRGDGLVSEDQANAILDLYETPRQSSARQQSLAIYVLLGIAAVFVGLALLLLIGYNWEALPAAIKLILILGTVTGTYAVAFWLRYGQNAKLFSELVFFLGSLFYGAAIWLIAQIFHLNAHYPDGFWWWAFGVLPIALCMDTLLLHLLVTLLLSIWVGTEILGFDPFWHVLFGRFWFFPNGCYSLLIFIALGLTWAYRKKSAVTVGLYIPVFAWWLILQPFAWHVRDNPVFFIGSVGALLLLLAEAHKEGSRFAIPYRLFGSLLCMGVLSVLSFRDIQRDIARLDDLYAFFLQTVVITLISGGVFVVAWRLQTRQEGTEAAYVQPVYAFVVRQWLPMSMVVLMFVLTIWHVLVSQRDADRNAPSILVPTILSNVAMLGLAFWLLMVGMREERGLPFAGGVFYFLLWAVMRYADLFGADLLGASCMFFLCGAAIFGFAMFWYRHKARNQDSGGRSQGSGARDQEPDNKNAQPGLGNPETGIRE